tara:strand:+ start:239 stop:499 length:261 start_codon:yes stop_codon:yes gene_type:complete
MLRTGGGMEDKLMRQLEGLGLMFGYPEDPDYQAPLESDTDVFYKNVLQSLIDDGATEDTIDELFQSDIETYAQQAEAILDAHTVGA